MGIFANTEKNIVIFGDRIQTQKISGITGQITYAPPRLLVR